MNQVLTRQDIDDAAANTSEWVRKTPVLDLHLPVLTIKQDIALKLELLQHTGSFKPRGAFNRILSQKAPKAGVIAASGGNHGLATAHAAQRLHLPCEIFVPEISSPVKVAGIRKLGAKVVITGKRYADAFEASQKRAQETGALVVHAYDQPEVAAGQGTVARELEEQIGSFDVALVAVGGGGLLAGVATWLGDRTRVVAIEPQRIPTLASALKHKEPVDVDVDGVAADSLGARRISAQALEVALRTGVESVLVSDEAIVEARRMLWEETRVAAEFGGATALAALTSGAWKASPGDRVAVIVCGGNTDPSDLK